MTNNRPLLYALLVVLLAGLIVAVGWAGYSLLSLAFESTPTPTAAPTVVTVLVVATPTSTASPATTAAPAETSLPSTTATPAPGQTPEVVVAADLINVRVAPGLDQAIIGSLPMGTVLRPEGRTADGQWLLVCCAFGQWGWVANLPELVTLNFDWALLPVVQFPTPLPPQPTVAPWPTSTATPRPPTPPGPLPTWTPWPTWPPPPPPTATPWPTWTPAPTATPVPLEGWRGEYFANPSLQGAPALVRIDPAVRFNWGFGSPAPGFPADNFSARWTRAVWLEQGQYRFQARVDDGVRVWLNDALIIDDWRDGSVRTVSADRTLAAGWYSLRVEYFERTGEAVIDFTWERDPQLFTEWRGDYFANPTLSGQPVVTRNDLQIAFDWGFSSPVPGVIPVDNFSVRWTRQLHFLRSDIYRFNLRVDDGARVRIDGVTILDAWREGPAADYVVDRFVQAGTRTIEVDYFERAGAAQVFFSWSLLPPHAHLDSAASAAAYQNPDAHLGSHLDAHGHPHHLGDQHAHGHANADADRDAHAHGHPHHLGDQHAHGHANADADRDAHAHGHPHHLGDQHAHSHANADAHRHGHIGCHRHTHCHAHGDGYAHRNARTDGHTHRDRGADGHRAAHGHAH
jgi:hypothetical protein